MYINEAIKKIMKEKGVTHKVIADALGYKRVTNVSSKLMTKNLTFDGAIEILNIIGYEVVVQPRRPGARPQGQIVIERSDK